MKRNFFLWASAKISWLSVLVEIVQMRHYHRPIKSNSFSLRNNRKLCTSNGVMQTWHIHYWYKYPVYVCFLVGNVPLPYLWRLVWMRMENNHYRMTLLNVLSSVNVKTNLQLCWIGMVAVWEDSIRWEVAIYRPCQLSPTLTLTGNIYVLCRLYSFYHVSDIIQMHIVSHCST